MQNCVSKYEISIQRPVIAIVGPTASGKSEIAQRLCELLDGEVVSADSMQVYKGMDIGTGKVPRQCRRVKHHGLDLVSPNEPYSAALYQAYARECFCDIDARSKRSVLCGGTGFYVRAALDDYSFPPGNQEANPVRACYTQIAEEKGGQAVWNILKEKDPDSANIIHINNVRKTIRALELLASGTSYSEQLQKLAILPQAVPARFVGLRVDPQNLNSCIDERIDEMINSGLIEEVKLLLNSGFRESITAPQAIGYREIVAALDESCSLEQAISNIKIATHRYAKRQRTWFRKDTRIRWIDVNPHDIDEAVSLAVSTLDTM